MTTRRQQIPVLWLASSSLDIRVLGWAVHHGTEGAGPQPIGEPPYSTGVEVVTHGWRIIQMSPLLPAHPGARAREIVPQARVHV